jgi:hypothetical protein
MATEKRSKSGSSWRPRLEWGGIWDRVRGSVGSVSAVLGGRESEFQLAPHPASWPDVRTEVRRAPFEHSDGHDEAGEGGVDLDVMETH